MFGNVQSLARPLALTGLLASQAVIAHGAQVTTATQDTLRLDAQSKLNIIVPQNATLAEKTAADELKNYLSRITGGTFSITMEDVAAKPPAIYVGATKYATQAGINVNSLKSEEWHIRTSGNGLVLVGGGTRGTLYAAYHLLEDNAGVRWWNPWEESVPTGKTLTFSRLDRHGKPEFPYRDIYMIYGNDNGRFAARSRLNREGDAGFLAANNGKRGYAAEYGGSREYGPPYHAHTLYGFLPPDKYAAAHPDWYIGQDKGVKPEAYNSQLAFSNPEMRQEFLKVLREIIRKSHEDAKAQGLPAPDVFSVSQMDNMVSFVSTPADAELVKREGSESAILLNFINYLADGIKDEFPDVYIDTLAYFSGEKAPKTIRPRDNVIIRLADTTSNVILPITHERNKVLHDFVVSWGKITKNLRIWDYAVTFSYPGLPEPTVQTYPVDFRFMRANNVEGLFTELEFPITADMRDLKVWMYAKLLEDPNQNYDKLLQDFTDGFYGPAGPAIREYLTELEKAATTPAIQPGGTEPTIADISWFANAGRHSYLTTDFIARANTVLDRATAAVTSDPVLSRRVRHARMPLDRAANLLFRRLMKQWRAAGQSESSFPLDRAVISARYLQSWNEQIDLRQGAVDQQAERAAAAAEVKSLTSEPAYVQPPAYFKDVSPADITVFGTSAMRRSENLVKVIEDPTVESGLTGRYEIPDNELDKYKLPMAFGVYDTLNKKGIGDGSIKAEDVKGPGYHWYKVNTVKLTGSDYLYIFWSWINQIDLDEAFADAPGADFEVWANVKFEGPAFPYGRADEKNAISVERVVVIKK